jgi:hypothetical protein
VTVSSSVCGNIPESVAQGRSDLTDLLAKPEGLLGSSHLLCGSHSGSSFQPLDLPYLSQESAISTGCRGVSAEKAPGPSAHARPYGQ